MDASNPPSLSAGPARPAWNKGKLPGPKPPLRLGHVWSIRARLQLERSTRDLALFNLAIDSKLRGYATLSRSASMMWLPNGYAVDRATVRQRKTGRPVRFELTEVTRQAVDDYLRESGLMSGQCLFPGHFGPDRPLTTRQYARLVSHPCLGTVGHGTLSPLRGVGRAWQLCSGISDSLGAAQPNWLVSQERGGQPWMNAAPHRDS